MSNLSVRVVSEQLDWGTPEALEYFRTHRSSVTDLYPSERFFLPEVVQEVTSCLDIGCAAGGFSRIMRTFNPELKYTGLDVRPEMVALGRVLNPDAEFRVSDGIHLEYDPDSFELVFSTGILHLNSQYQEIVRSAYRTCSRYLLCDFRLTEGSNIIGEMDVNFGSSMESKHPLPYFVINLKEHVAFLNSLHPRPRSIHIKGYYHPPSPSARLPLEEVIMAFVLLIKGDGTLRDTTVTVEVEKSSPKIESFNPKLHEPQSRVGR